MSVDEANSRATLDLEDRARSLIPYIRQNQMRINAVRSVPEDVFARLKEAGLLGLIRPKRYGGLELGPDAVLRVTALLGQGDGSTAWVYVVLTSHDHLVGLYPGIRARGSVDVPASSLRLQLHSYRNGGPGRWRLPGFGKVVLLQWYRPLRLADRRRRHLGKRGIAPGSAHFIAPQERR